LDATPCRAILASGAGAHRNTMNDKQPRGLLKFLNYEERKAAEREVRNQLTELYEIADDFLIQIEDFELLLDDLLRGVSLDLRLNS
jgi:hypothetical protein